MLRLTPAETANERTDRQSAVPLQRPASIRLEQSYFSFSPSTEDAPIPAAPVRPPPIRPLPPSPPKSFFEWSDPAATVAPLAPRAPKHHRRSRLRETSQARQPSPPVIRPSSLGAEEQRGLCVAAARLKLRAAQKMVNEVLLEGDLLSAPSFDAIAEATEALQRAEDCLHKTRLTPLCPDEANGLVFQFTLED